MRHRRSAALDVLSIVLGLAVGGATVAMFLIAQRVMALLTTLPGT